MSAVVAFVLWTSAAQAITFTIDDSQSSVTLTESWSGFVCGVTDCGVSVVLADGLDGTTFDLASVGESSSFDFLTFTGQNTGLVAYDITATIAFNPPGFATTSGGTGGSLLFFGSIIGSVLTWTDVPALVVLDDGSEVTIDFEDVYGLFFSDSVTTTARVTLEKLVAAPLPASGLMLLLGLGGLAGIRRLKRKVAA